MSQWHGASYDLIGALEDLGSYSPLFHNSSVTMDKSDSSRTKSRKAFLVGLLEKQSSCYGLGTMLTHVV